MSPKYPAKQNEKEITDFVTFLREEKVGSYLEIGSKWGGSLWRVAQALPKGARIVSVDWQKGPNKSLRQCVAELRKAGYDIHLFEADSTNPKIVEQVKNLGPYDACFIDANHTMAYVRKDWENYGPMCRIVCFHDVSYVQREGKAPVNVPELWAELKQQYRSKEIRYEPKDNGIGILWPAQAAN